MKLNDLKRLHNALLTEGQQKYEEVSALYKRLIDLQKQIEEIEGENYDPIPLIFGDGFYIDEADE
ncbi:MAG: hypothetical protein RL563_2227 [Pseudomonadota bacterium]|jgi:hypothetical protein